MEIQHKNHATVRMLAYTARFIVIGYTLMFTAGRINIDWYGWTNVPDAVVMKKRISEAWRRLRHALLLGETGAQQ